MRPIHFPIVNAARIVPIPSPSRCPKRNPVMQAVTVRQITSNAILILGYPTRIILESSLGNKSVGIIGNPHRLDNAIPIQIRI